MHLTVRELHNNFKQFEVMLSRLRIGHTHGDLMDRNDQQRASTNVAFEKQTLKIKHFLEESPPLMDSRKKYIIQSDIKTLQVKYYKV